MGARRAAGAASRTDNLARTGKALNNAVAGKSKAAVAANKLNGGHQKLLLKEHLEQV